ncbi:MAG: hypothetical protein ABSA67_16160 [Candidatus Brocadiia bacterium]
MKSIAILMHECYRRRSHTYLIDSLAEVWNKQGLRASCLYGVREPCDADLLIPHIDLTRTPREYVEYVRAFPGAAGRGVADISKRRVSAQLLSRGDGYHGPVMVKTDANSGGLPEDWLFRWRHPSLARAEALLEPLLQPLCGGPWARLRVLREYPVYPSPAEVPKGVFRNRALVVERFLPEREGARYFMRHYLFLGDRARSTRVAGSVPFLKRAACATVDEGLPVPDEVIALRRRLALDYGKIDYVMHGGKAVILDANRTPAGPGTPEATARTVGDLADGIWSLLAK